MHVNVLTKSPVRAAELMYAVSIYWWAIRMEFKRLVYDVEEFAGTLALLGSVSAWHTWSGMRAEWREHHRGFEGFLRIWRL
jgi:hypothetical protein